MWRVSAHLATRARPWRRSGRAGKTREARVRSGKQGDGPPTLQPWVKFCSSCGGEVQAAVPEGDSQWRHVCTSCGKVDYQNPKMVVGCIVEHQGKMLLCRRGIEPCKGMWTLPAGFMELGESAVEGAKRETLEEVKAMVDVHAPFAHFDVPRIGQAYILFRGSLASPYVYGTGPESLEVKLFPFDDIPYAEIAFSSITIAIEKYVEDRRIGRYSVHHGIIDKKPGSSPNDPTGYELKGYFATPTVHTV